MGKGYISAVQFRWSPEMYKSRESFYGSLRSVLDRLAEKLPEKREVCLVAFPEDIGTPLVFLDEPESLLRSKTLKAAIGRLIYRNASRVLRCRIRYKVGWIRALALAKAASIGRVYFEVFSDLATEYGIYIVAGSVLLPRFGLDSDISKIDYSFSDGNVYNISFLFGPDGRLIGSQKKVYLVPGLEDKDGFDITGGSLDELEVFDTPLGRIGIAVCLDAFKEDIINKLEEKGAEILIQPSANPEPWTKDQQLDWLNSSWKAVDSSNSLVYSLNPMMTGHLFDLGFEGQSAIFCKNAWNSLGYMDLEARSHFAALARSQLDEEILVYGIE